MRKSQRQFDIVISDQELPQEIVETQVMNSLHSLKSLDGIVEVGNGQESRDLQGMQRGPFLSQELELSDEELSAR